ncbi:hypothetical protein ABZU25_26240 [Micromonospora sp. NPDC005215]|uniref:hypothetical protein n=1 Tax=Micromonospora sp. NPDC005215 TaxID=3157024 RepID=UPI0033A38B56
MSRVRATVAAQALAGAETARRVIDQHLRSDIGGRCLACGEIEPCRQRETAHAVLFGHARQLPRRHPLNLIGTRGDFGASTFDAFGRPQ